MTIEPIMAFLGILRPILNKANLNLYMMKKTLLIIGCVVGSFVVAKAQSVSPDVIASAGEFYSNASGSISWTLGEPMGETYTSANNILTQGFQQPWDFGTGITSGSVPVNADVFPNPTADEVHLQFGNNSNGQYVIDVYNTLGQQLSTSQYAATPSAQTTVSLAAYENGVYFITVRKIDGTETSTFKITKSE